MRAASSAYNLRSIDSPLLAVRVACPFLIPPKCSRYKARTWVGYPTGLTAQGAPLIYLRSLYAPTNNSTNSVRRHSRIDRLRPNSTFFSIHPPGMYPTVPTAIFQLGTSDTLSLKCQTHRPGQQESLCLRPQRTEIS